MRSVGVSLLKLIDFYTLFALGLLGVRTIEGGTNLAGLLDAGNPDVTSFDNLEVFFVLTSLFNGFSMNVQNTENSFHAESLRVRLHCPFEKCEKFYRNIK